MSIIQCVPWRVQPQMPVGIRPELNPLIGINPGVSFTRTIAGESLTIGAGHSSIVNRYGKEMDSAGAGLVSRAVSVAAQYPYTLVAVARNDAAATSCIASLANASDKTVRVYATSTGAVQAQHIGATTNASATTSQIALTGTPFALVAVFDSQSSIRVYATGAFATAFATSGTDVGAMSASTIAAFGGYSGSVQNALLNGGVNFAQWLRYAPTESQAQDWLRNVWQLSTPQTRRIWVPVSAGGGGGFQAAWARNANTILAGGRL